MCNKKRAHRLGNQAGISLIEVVMFIVVVSVGLAGALSVINIATKNSADPLLQKQALAIAEALIEQVSLMPFCDPAVRIPNGTCPAPDPFGPEAGEVHGSLAPFDNVNDYNGLVLSAGQGDIASSAGVAIPPGYSANISVVPDSAFGPPGGILPAADVYLITVTVNVISTGSAVVLHAYRTLY